MQAPILLLLFATARVSAAQPPASVPSNSSAGMLVTGLAATWHATADGKDLKQMQQTIDAALQAKKMTGADGISYGPGLVWVYRESLKPKYWAAAQSLHDQLLAQLQTKNGTGAKPLSPEDRYSAATFLAAYSATTGDAFTASLAVLKNSADTANMKSASAAAWSLAAMVDTLAWMPVDTNGGADLLALIHFTAAALQSAPPPEADVAARRIRFYAVLKAVRLGYLPQADEKPAVDAAAKLPTPVADAPEQDPVKTAAARMLSSELDQAPTQGLAQGKVVAVDAWFNSQKRKGPIGNEELFHYKWNDDSNSGFSFFGRAFQRFGAKLATLAEEPSPASLKEIAVYIIASPDIPSKNPLPHFVNAKDVNTITQWVNNGGVLLLMQNDGTSAEFDHFNTLTERFGIHFNPVLRNPVEGNQYEQGKVVIPATTGVFKDPHTAYMKEICTISPQSPAKAVLVDMLHDSGDVYMAVAKYGKGTVYAVVDPWLYNEYTDGNKLPAEYDQFAAAKDLASWVLSQAK